MSGLKTDYKRSSNSLLENYCSPTINRLWMKFQRTGSTQDLPRCGKLQALNEREERVVIRNLLAIPGTSIRSIA